ncbi:hypothetical protein [Nocardioides sp. MH1]|uniref:hypothetical protein n=1 Tax=Nocardioides sp. MH1 TaxID=3242490 RepID=UPI00352238E6
MTARRSSAHRLTAAALSVALPATVLVGGARQVSADEPTSTTSTATLHASGPSGGRDVVVTAEPDLGRVEISPYYWPSGDGGRYLHVGLGTSTGNGCQVHRWVVVDTLDPSASTAYDAAGTALPETEQFTVAQDWADQVARIGVAPFAPVDCVRASSYGSADPAHHGARIWNAPVAGLEPVGFADAPGSFPASVTCPRSITWGEPVDLEIGVSTDPGVYPPAGVIPHPSRLAALYVSLDPGPFTVASTPDPPSGVDLWTEEPWSGSFVLQPDTAEVYGVKLAGTVSVDGATSRWTCGTVPVSMPAPADWSGSLAGATWWRRGTDSNSGIGSYQLHRTYEFLDDSWVFVSGEYAGARTEPCTTVAHRWPEGCHRYYYDRSSGRLQLDDRRAKPAPAGWLMPVSGSRFTLFDETHVVVPASPGQRFAYVGEGAGGDLRLRRDGTYHYQGQDPDHPRHVVWSGRYRFSGGDAHTLVLRHPGHDFRDAVQLYFADVDGRRTLVDLDTHHRVFRFRAEP